MFSDLPVPPRTHFGDSGYKMRVQSIQIKLYQLEHIITTRYLTYDDGPIMRKHNPSQEKSMFFYLFGFSFLRKAIKHGIEYHLVLPIQHYCIRD